VIERLPHPDEAIVRAGYLKFGNSVHPGSGIRYMSNIGIL